MDHRAKNALAVVQAALRLTRAADLPSYVRAIEGRVAALARAQTLLAEDRWTGSDLRNIAEGRAARPFLAATQHAGCWTDRRYRCQRGRHNPWQWQCTSWPPTL
ncbi:HWE histidine kinase domain-containing protein [Dankookia sp. P2]|uniref:HWE histidine kinase domain-containing protein n=1 Tax=Dankookia sp. P2 TaxID=3423955 RepID=UPI003D66CDDE